MRNDISRIILYGILKYSDAYTYYNFGISYIGTIDNIVGLGGYIEKKTSNLFKIKHLYNFYGRIIHVIFMLIIDSKIFIVDLYAV